MSHDPCPKCVARPEPGTIFSLYHCAQDGTCPRRQAEAPPRRNDLLMAALGGPHEIEAEKIVLHFDPSMPGLNALAQLADRLAAAAAKAVRS